MASIVKGFILLSSLIVFGYTLYVVAMLTLFLSKPRSISMAHTWIFNLLDNKSRLETAYGPITFDIIYLIGFIFQHSFLKSAIVKNVLSKLRLTAATRTIYTLTSSLSLHYLVLNWVPAQSIVLWQINVDESAPLWWTFVITHTVCWSIIYGGCLIMDLTELVGIKQTYYDLNNCSEPLLYKSLGLRNLYSHVRHPSFVGFSLILFITNVMSLDRLLLAVILTMYMYVAWSTDANDVTYQKQQLQRKKYELKSQ